MKLNRSIHLALAMGALAAVPALAAAQTGSTSPPQQRESGTPGAAKGGGAQQGGAQQGGSAQGGSAQGGSAQQQGNPPGASGGQRAQQQGQGQKKQAMKLQEQISFQVEDGCTYTASVNGRIEQAAAGKSQPLPGSPGGQPGGGSQGRGGAGAQGQTGGAAQGPAGGSQAQAGGAQDRGHDTGGSQTQAGAAQGGSHAQAGAAQGGSHAQAGAAQGGSQAGAGTGDQEKVKPNLTVSASMSCPNAPAVRITDTLKTDTAVSRSELEEMISKRASIATEKSGRFCMYVPQFELTRERLSGKGIAQLCRVPAPDQKQGMR